MIDTATRWFFQPMPLARVAVFRTLVYSFVFVDLFLTAAWAMKHAHVPGELYEPLVVAGWLHLPTPTFAFVTGVQAALVIATALALTGRWPRIAGAAVFFLYLQWMYIAMSYGKVDHDRVAYLVALAVLPTVGRARWSDRGASEAAGWALSCVQLAVMLTYLLAAFAKLRFGGIEWVNGATLMRAVLRRGTFLVDPLTVENPWLLHATQWFILGFELLLSPFMLLRNRLGRSLVLVMLAFHLVTYASIKIIFFPHCIALLSYLPLERLPEWLSRGQSRAERMQNSFPSGSARTTQETSR